MADAVDGSAAAAALEAAHARERALLEQVQQLQADLAAARRQSADQAALLEQAGLTAVAQPQLLGGPSAMPPPAAADAMSPPLRRFDAARMTGAGLVELQGAEADAKLWAGAAASGWRVVERYANAAKAGKWRYVSPAGYWYQSRGEAFAADARPPPAAPPTPPPAEAEAAAGAGGMPADVVDAKLWDGAAAGGWSVPRAATRTGPT